ncbi:hypothetical protein DSO57_1028946 [Entomophthora muscae]|uniref:Uncharacterized protein n=1 Tax=Entomophthora muscae TaxID=34485 RepID=A0ACC2UN08_9FUNG|nr:hypothetical protein DSO57_1028946 [Entomophthora muscae]
MLSENYVRLIAAKAAQKKPPQPDPQVAVLNAQVSVLQQEFAALCATVTDATSSVGPTDNNGYCPGVRFLSTSPHCVPWVKDRG